MITFLIMLYLAFTLLVTIGTILTIIGFTRDNKVNGMQASMLFLFAFLWSIYFTYHMYN